MATGAFGGVDDTNWKRVMTNAFVDVNAEPAPPYGIIARCLRAGQVIPFLGAGASLVDVEPTSGDVGASTTVAPAKRLPSGTELAQILADEAQFPSSDNRDRTDLAKVASYYVDVSDRRTLRERLHGLLDCRSTPGRIHRLLAAVPRPLLIVTTNYDSLMEQALEAANKPYDVVIYPADGSKRANSVLWRQHGATEPTEVRVRELEIELESTTVIFKMHGTCSRGDQEDDHYVITEEDYVEFLSRMSGAAAIPAQFIEHFEDRSFLFLGYGLRDWNLRLMLKNLEKGLRARVRRGDDASAVSSWAIQKSPSQLERQLWSSRKVKIFDLTLDEFTHRLEGVPT